MGAGGGGWSKLNYFNYESKCNFFLWGVCGGELKQVNFCTKKVVAGERGAIVSEFL